MAGGSIRLYDFFLSIIQAIRALARGPAQIVGPNSPSYALLGLVGLPWLLLPRL